MNNDKIKLEYLQVEQPIGIFYIVKMKAVELLKIAFNDVRRIKLDEDKLDVYYGLQRSPSEKRLKDIAKYVTYEDATFPSSITVNINVYDKDKIFKEDTNEPRQRNISIEDNKLIINNQENIAQIIDGQHRLLGLSRAIDNCSDSVEKKKLENFELAVTIYVDIDIESCAMIFSTINKAQTKVNKSLVYDLYDLAKTRSPYKTAHDIVRVLNSNSKSPFQNKIKMLGTANSKEESIAQATLVESIVNYISNKPMKDRNQLINNKDIDIYDNEEERYFFRDYFRKNNDIKILIILVKYFSAIKNILGETWDNQNYIASKSTGVIALMRLLKDIINKKKVDEIENINFKSELETIDASSMVWTNDEYPSGGVGQRKLYNHLREKLKLE